MTRIIACLLLVTSCARTVPDAPPPEPVEDVEEVRPTCATLDDVGTIVLNPSLEQWEIDCQPQPTGHDACPRQKCLRCEVARPDVVEWERAYCPEDA